MKQPCAPMIPNARSIGAQKMFVSVNTDRLALATATWGSWETRLLGPAMPANAGRRNEPLRWPPAPVAVSDTACPEPWGIVTRTYGSEAGMFMAGWFPLPRFRSKRSALRVPLASNSTPRRSGELPAVRLGVGGGAPPPPPPPPPPPEGVRSGGVVALGSCNLDDLAGCQRAVVHPDLVDRAGELGVVGARAVVGVGADPELRVLLEVPAVPDRAEPVPACAPGTRAPST